MKGQAGMETVRPPKHRWGRTPRRRGTRDLGSMVHASAASELRQLRRQAEVQLSTHPGNRWSEGELSNFSPDSQRLLHELQVHQLELEMQNTELREARQELESALEKYTDLYDFAPVGYFSLDENGVIQSVNLTGAAMLGMDRSQLIRRRLEDFALPSCRPGFQAFLKDVFATPGKHSGQVSLQKRAGAVFWADVQATVADSSGRPRWCRLAVSDITALKHAGETQQRLEALALANQHLAKEIFRRQKVEKALRKSQQNQKQLLEHACSLQEQLRRLSHQILQAQEEERKRISRELHDEIVQTLVGINVHLEALATQVNLHPEALKRKIVRTQRLVEQSVAIVHRFARELRPMLLDDLGLIASLHAFMKVLTKRTGIRVRFVAFAEVEELPSATLTVLYRVVHSALTNVAQHAQASRADVTIRNLAQGVEVEITDNGQSFEVERVLRAKNNHRLGLIGMRERVEMVGGHLSVESHPGTGTVIRALVPCSGLSTGGRAAERGPQKPAGKEA